MLYFVDDLLGHFGGWGRRRRDRGFNLYFVVGDLIKELGRSGVKQLVNIVKLLFVVVGESIDLQVMFFIGRDCLIGKVFGAVG